MTNIVVFSSAVLDNWRKLYEKFKKPHCDDYGSIQELKNLIALFEANNNIMLVPLAHRYSYELSMAGKYFPEREKNCIRAIYDVLVPLAIFHITRAEYDFGQTLTIQADTGFVGD